MGTRRLTTNFTLWNHYLHKIGLKINYRNPNDYIDTFLYQLNGVVVKNYFINNVLFSY